MRVLVVGGGGREHAIVEALRESEAQVYAVAKHRNPGIARAAEAYLQAAETDVPRIVDFAAGAKADFAVIGPEAPLEAGIVDALEKAGVPAVGPTREAAKLETSKEFTRHLLQEHGIPGGIEHWTFDDLDAFARFLREVNFEIVIKPIGLTGGKGVRVQGDHFTSPEEAMECAREILQGKVGGTSRFLVERKVVGEEFSLQAFVDGRHLCPMPLARDHKRALEGDKGPNTGGMGSVTMADHLLPWVTKWDLEEALGILERTVLAMAARGAPFRGVLYGGFMNTADGPRLLEYNVRFADPEGINVLALLEEDFAELCGKLLDGTLPSSARFARKASVCKYVVPPGYGIAPKAGGRIAVDEAGVAAAGARLYYANVDERDDGLRLGTSRTLAVVGVHEDLATAEMRTEDALKFIQGDFTVRHDVGTQKLLDHYAARMAKLRPKR